MNDSSTSEPSSDTISRVGEICFGTAAFFLSGAALAMMLNFFLIEKFAAGGMLGVGMLYLGMGIAELRATKCPESPCASDPSR